MKILIFLQNFFHVLAKTNKPPETNMMLLQLLLPLCDSIEENLEKSDNSGYLPIHHAASSGNNSIILKLYKKYDYLDVNGNTPLHLAAYFNQLGCFKCLLAKMNSQHFTNPGSSSHLVNSPNQLGLSSVHIACLQKDSEEIVRYILENPVLASTSLNVPDSEGNPPILLAAKSGNLPLVQLLLEKGANIHSKNHNNHFSIIHQAVCEENNESFLREYLIDSKTVLDPNVKALNGASPLHICVLHENESSSEYMEVLLAASADINIPDDRQRTPLHYAVQFNKLKSLLYLLQNNTVDLFALDKDGRSPFHYACIKGNVEAIQFILKFSSNRSIFHVQDKTGFIPCFYAIRSNSFINNANVVLIRELIVNSPLWHIANNVSLLQIAFECYRNDPSVVLKYVIQLVLDSPSSPLPLLLNKLSISDIGMLKEFQFTGKQQLLQSLLPPPPPSSPPPPIPSRRVTQTQSNKKQLEVTMVCVTESISVTNDLDSTAQPTQTGNAPDTTPAPTDSNPLPFNESIPPPLYPETKSQSNASKQVLVNQPKPNELLNTSVIMDDGPMQPDSEPDLPVDSVNLINRLARALKTKEQEIDQKFANQNLRNLDPLMDPLIQKKFLDGTLPLKHCPITYKPLKFIADRSSVLNAHLTTGHYTKRELKSVLLWKAKEICVFFNWIGFTEGCKAIYQNGLEFLPTTFKYLTEQDLEAMNIPLATRKTIIYYQTLLLAYTEKNNSFSGKNLDAFNKWCDKQYLLATGGCFPLKKEELLANNYRCLANYSPTLHKHNLDRRSLYMFTHNEIVKYFSFSHPGDRDTLFNELDLFQAEFSSWLKPKKATLFQTFKQTLQRKSSNNNFNK